jgi:hypothetical protein
MPLEFDPEEETPDGRFRIRRVCVMASEDKPLVWEVAPNTTVLLARPLWVWYFASPLVDRWLPLGQSTNGESPNRFAILEHQRTHVLARMLANNGMAWDEIEEPRGIIDKPDGAGYVVAVDGKVLKLELPE